MKKAIIISDSFKGTLSSGEICGIARECLGRVFPDCVLVEVPVADGGEGTVACFHQACGGELVSAEVTGPYGESVTAQYLRLPQGQAVIEMASAAGLPQVGSRKDPCGTTTFGVGQLIRHAVEHGSSRILLGLGGSCTNDGGCGCAAALGIKFRSAAGQEFLPVGGTLDQIASIDLAGAERLLENVTLTAMCDIDNPMHGETGAACVFGPQKGADAAMVKLLDSQLKALDRTIRTCLGKQVAELPGAGAAGAFGGGLVAFFGAELRPGIEAVLDLVGFDGLLADCDMVFTGEGRLDSQSLRGKVISGVCRRAGARNIPVVAVVGGVLPEAEDLDPGLGLHAVFSINRQAMDFQESRRFSRENYTYTFENILRLIQAAEWMAETAVIPPVCR